MTSPLEEALKKALAAGRRLALRTIIPEATEDEAQDDQKPATQEPTPAPRNG